MQPFASPVRDVSVERCVYGGGKRRADIAHLIAPRAGVVAAGGVISAALVVRMEGQRAKASCLIIGGVLFERERDEGDIRHPKLL